MTIGERIKAARKQFGITQKELGDKLGISYQSVAQWENDLRNPKYETLQRIADALNADVNWLRNGYTLEQRDQAMKDYVARRFTEVELEQRLRDSYGALNIEGKEKAVERVEELTEIPKFQKLPAPPDDMT